MSSELAIAGIVDQLWEQYDTDNKGALNQKQTEQFVKTLLES